LNLGVPEFCVVFSFPIYPSVGVRATTTALKKFKTETPMNDNAKDDASGRHSVAIGVGVLESHPSQSG